MNGTDYNVGQMHDYIYDSNLMQVTGGTEKQSPAIWAAGGAYSASELAEPFTGEGYGISYDEVFTVTLDGVKDAEGVIAPHGGVNIEVTADSSVSGKYFRDTDDRLASVISTVGAGGDISIYGENGATLTINGRLLSDGNVSVSGDVKVIVLISDSGMNGVQANSLTLTDGASLEVRYVGSETSANDGVTFTDLSVSDSYLTVDGFLNGLKYGADNAETDLTADNSQISIVSNEYGITANYAIVSGWNEWGYWEAIGSHGTVNLNLGNGTVMTIDSGMGTRFTNIALCDADLTVNAIHSGIGDTSYPAALSMTSGDSEVGSLTVTVADAENGAYAMAASSMEINGGTLTFVSGNADGVLYAPSNCVWNFANCTAYVKSTSFGSGINAKDAANQQVTIEGGIDRFAHLIIQDCQIAVACWMPYDMSIIFTVMGILEIDNYGVPQNEWDLTARFVDAEGNPAPIIYRNRVSE